MFKKKFAAVLCLGGILFCAGDMLAQDAQPPAQKPWKADYHKARQLARDAGKPMFVVFR